MARRKVRGFGIVVDEPKPIPQHTEEVLSSTVVPDTDDYRTEVLHEEVFSDVSAEELIDKLYKKYESRHKSAETVTYVSDIQNLNIVLDVLRPNGSGVTVSQIVVEFRRGRYETDDIYVQKALERHPSYGGKGDESTTDSKTYLFWKDTFPQWKWDMIASYESELTTLPRED
jgi:hypothetical protein